MKKKEDWELTQKTMTKKREAEITQKNLRRDERIPRK
jgi:hypothetical protein